MEGFEEIDSPLKTSNLLLYLWILKEKFQKVKIQSIEQQTYCFVKLVLSEIVGKLLEDINTK